MTAARDPRELEELHAGSRMLRATFRSAPFVAVYQLGGALVVLLSAFGATRGLLGVGLVEAAQGMGALLATNLLATFAFHRFGEKDRRYKLVATAEIITYQSAVMWLVYQSGSASSFFWIVWLGQAAANGGITEHQRPLLAICVLPPIVLGVVFLVARGDVASASACLLAALVGFCVFSAGLRRNLRLAEAVVARDAAQAELAALRLEEERRRIARDLHDGVAADLVALASRADWAKEGLDPTRRGELAQISGRARDALDDLRTIVWSMRTPDQAPEDLARYVEQRCRELAPRDVTLEVRATVHEAARAVSGADALSLVRMAQECCRNALRHAAPTRISLTLELGEVASLTVEDDGCGLPPGVEERPQGGLANLRARVANGGSFELRRLATGSRVTLALPLTRAPQPG